MSARQTSSATLASAQQIALDKSVCRPNRAASSYVIDGPGVTLDMR